MNTSEPVQDNPSTDGGRRRSPRSRGTIGGFVLIALGVLFLADNLLPDFRFGDYWPVILVAVGVGILLKANRSS